MIRRKQKRGSYNYYEYTINEIPYGYIPNVWESNKQKMIYTIYKVNTYTLMGKKYYNNYYINNYYNKLCENLNKNNYIRKSKLDFII